MPLLVDADRDLARFAAKFSTNGPLPLERPELGKCWPWLAGLSHGYGSFWTGERTIHAHRWAYERAFGPAPGLVIDHLCRRPLCVRPSHLEAVPDRVNRERGDGYGMRNGRRTRCPSGHEYTPANTYRSPRGDLQCRTCRRDAMREVLCRCPA